MKILLFALLFCTSLHSQIINKEDWKSLVPMTVAGMADGVNEEISHHYRDFKRIFPNASDQFWDPKISWTNKYKNGDYTQGRKFFGSTTFLVWTTDGYHMTRMVKNTMIVTSIGLNVGSKRGFKHFAKRAIMHTAAYHLGFFLTYDLAFGGIKQW
jgi:hypothetical protein